MVLARTLVGCVAVVALVAGCSGGGGGGGNPPPTRTLSVAVSGGGSGTVTSSPAGISCTSGSASGCSATFAQDAAVTLTAAPSVGSDFAGWAGACAGTGTCPVVLGSDLAVTATFVPEVGPVLRTLTVAVGGSGSGTVTSSPPGITCASASCSATFADGTSVTLTATPGGGGATFAGWGGACAASGTSPTCTLSMTDDQGVTAGFDAFVPPPRRTLSVFTSGSGTGHVTTDSGGIDCPGTCSTTYPDGTLVTLTAAPTVAGSSFRRWLGACAAEATATCALTLAGDASTTAEFTQQRVLTVAMRQDGSGRVLSVPAGIDCASGSAAGCSAAFDQGATVTLTATTAAGTTFLGWGDPCWGTVAPCAVTMQSNDWTLTADFSAWIVHRPFPGNLHAATRLGATLVAVGDVAETNAASGAWLTSTDGLAWTGHERPGTPPLRGVAAGGGTAVAVGDGGTILTTSDAASWTAQASGTAAQLLAVASGGGTFVAVGAAGTILSSADGGATWTARTSGTARDLLAVTHGNGTFVAVGYAGTVLTSADGQAWAAPASETVARLTAVAYGPAGFVAVGDTGWSTTSATGASWAARAGFGSHDLVGVTALATSYVAMDDQRTAWISPDGAAWTGYGADAAQGVGPAVADGTDLYAVGRGGGIARSTDGGAGWSLVVPPGGQLYEAAWGAGRYVVVGFNGAIYSSPDGATWTSRRAGKDELVTSVAFGNGVFAAVSSGGMLVSGDGDTWTVAAPSVGASGGVVRYASGRGFVAIGAGGADTAVKTSPDGSAWTPQATVSGALLRSLAWGASTFVAAGDAGKIYSNPDPASGGQWILETILPAPLRSLTFGNGTFVGIDGATGFASLTSTTGVGASWTSHPSAESLHPILAFGDGVFRSPASISADGAAWTPATVPTIPGEDPGFIAWLHVAVYGEPAVGWVVAKRTAWGGIAFASHP